MIFAVCIITDGKRQLLDRCPLRNVVGRIHINRPTPTRVDSERSFGSGGIVLTFNEHVYVISWPSDLMKQVIAISNGPARAVNVRNSDQRCK